MTTIPEPLVPADCILRGMPFMPLDVQRLRDSDMASVVTGEEFRCAVLLWCASWHQAPAASLPDDDAVLAGLVGYARTPREWRKHRQGALRGWIKCADGRLYHPVIAEKALQAWDMRDDYREVVSNKTSRQQRWRDQLKAMSEQLRAVGVTPPMNPTKAELQRLISLHVGVSDLSTPARHVDANVDAHASTARRAVDQPETAKTETETETCNSVESSVVDFTDSEVRAGGAGGVDQGCPALVYEPGPVVTAQLQIAGIPLSLITPEVLGEFRVYWARKLPRAGPDVLDAKFFQRMQDVKVRGARHGQDPAGGRSSGRRPSLSERVRGGGGDAAGG